MSLNTKALRAEARAILQKALAHPEHRAFGLARVLDKLTELKLLTGPTGGSLVWTLTPEGVDVAGSIIVKGEA